MNPTKEAADFLLAELEEKFLAVTLVPAPEQRFPGHMIRVAINQNPSWYRHLWDFHGYVRRGTVIMVLERIAKTGVLNLKKKYDRFLQGIVERIATDFEALKNSITNENENEMKNTSLKTLAATPISKIPDAFTARAKQESVSFMQCGALAEIASQKVTKEHKDGYAFLRSEGCPARKIDNAKVAGHSYRELYAPGHINEEEFYGLSFTKCRAIKFAMGGNAKGEKPKVILAPETVAKLIKTVEPDRLADEVWSLAKHDLTVEEYTAKQTAATPEPTSDTATDTSKTDEDPKPSTKTKKHVRNVDAITAQLAADVDELTGALEGTATPPKEVDTIIAKLEGLLDVLRPSAKVVKIKGKTTKKTA